MRRTREVKQRTEKDAKYAIIQEERQETFEKLRKTLYTHFILRYIFDSIGFRLQTFLHFLVLSFIQTISGIWRILSAKWEDKIVKFQRRETKMIDSQQMSYHILSYVLQALFLWPKHCLRKSSEGFPKNSEYLSFTFLFA